MNQSDLHTTYSKCLEIQPEARKWLEQRQFNYFVTANFNSDTLYESSRTALRDWHAFLDRKLLGPGWSKMSAGRRTSFIAFVEHPESNLHFHMMLQTSSPQGFPHIAEGIWEKLVPAGSLDVRFLKTDEDKNRAAVYATKDLWKFDAINKFILSQEFSSIT